LTPLCVELLKTPVVLESTVASLCLLIICPDSKTVMKLIPVARAVFGTYHSFFDDQMANSVLIHCIRGLQVNGSDEGCCGPLLGLAFLIYSSLRPVHPSLLRVLEEVPDLSAENREAFDSRVLASIQNNEVIVEKNKRELMRKILKPVIALRIGDKFRRPVHLRPIRNGPSLSMSTA